MPETLNINVSFYVSDKQFLITINNLLPPVSTLLNQVFYFDQLNIPIKTLPFQLEAEIDASWIYAKRNILFNQPMYFKQENITNITTQSNSNSIGVQCNIFGSNIYFKILKEKPKQEINLGLIIGSAIAGVSGFILIIIVIIMVVKKHKKNKEN